MRGLVATPNDTAIRTELTRILSSASFASSPRMNRFLKYVVETTLEGKGALIKEYVIAPVSSNAHRPGQGRLIAASLAAAIVGVGIFWFSRSQPASPPRLIPLTSL